MLYCDTFDVAAYTVTFVFPAIWSLDRKHGAITISGTRASSYQSLWVFYRRRTLGSLANYFLVCVDIMCWTERINRSYGCGGATTDGNATRKESHCAAYSRWQQEARAWGEAESYRLGTYVPATNYNNLVSNPCPGAVNYRAQYTTARPCRPDCRQNQAHFPSYIPLNMYVVYNSYLWRCWSCKLGVFNSTSTPLGFALYYSPPEVWYASCILGR